jgi:hypothetical protein
MVAEFFLSATINYKMQNKLSCCGYILISFPKLGQRTALQKYQYKASCDSGSGISEFLVFFRAIACSGDPSSVL